MKLTVWCTECAQNGARSIFIGHLILTQPSFIDPKTLQCNTLEILPSIKRIDIHKIRTGNKLEVQPCVDESPESIWKDYGSLGMRMTLNTMTQHYARDLHRDSDLAWPFDEGPHWPCGTATLQGALCYYSIWPTWWNVCHNGSNQRFEPEPFTLALLRAPGPAHKVKANTCITVLTAIAEEFVLTILRWPIGDLLWPVVYLCHPNLEEVS